MRLDSSLIYRFAICTIATVGLCQGVPIECNSWSAPVWANNGYKTTEMLGIDSEYAVKSWGRDMNVYFPTKPSKEIPTIDQPPMYEQTDATIAELYGAAGAKWSRSDDVSAECLPENEDKTCAAPPQLWVKDNIHGPRCCDSTITYTYTITDFPNTGDGAYGCLPPTGKSAAASVTTSDTVKKEYSVDEYDGISQSCNPKVHQWTGWRITASLENCKKMCIKLGECFGVFYNGNGQCFPYKAKSGTNAREIFGKFDAQQYKIWSSADHMDYSKHPNAGWHLLLDVIDGEGGNYVRNAKECILEDPSPTCTCRPSWNFNGSQYSRCAVTPDDKDTEWCYTTDNCAGSTPSTRIAGDATTDKNETTTTDEIEGGYWITCTRDDPGTWGNSCPARWSSTVDYSTDSECQPTDNVLLVEFPTESKCPRDSSVDNGNKYKNHQPPTEATDGTCGCQGANANMDPDHAYAYKPSWARQTLYAEKYILVEHVGPGDVEGTGEAETLTYSCDFHQTVYIGAGDDLARGGCFPANATVELKDGQHTTMSKLQVGDVVRVGPTEFSKVYMFSHKTMEVKAKFVKLTTAKGAVRLTAGHYLYVNGQLQTARTVKLGDLISTGNVTAVSAEWADGLFNPHTLHGDIVVDGVQTSTYTENVAPALAHALLWPLRMLATAGVKIAGDDYNQGGESWAKEVLNLHAGELGLHGDAFEHVTK